MITIDGDNYAMTVLSYNQILKLRKEKTMGDFQITQDWQLNTMTYCEGDVPYEYTIMGSNTGQKIAGLSGRYGLVKPVWSMGKGILAYRPALVLLNESGRFRDTEYMKDTPPGTVVHGGTAYLNDEPFQPNMNRIILTGEILRIGDTFSEKTALSWYYIYNMLVCKDLICYIDMEDPSSLQFIQWLDAEIPN